MKNEKLFAAVLLPIGLLMLSISGICGHYLLIGDFQKGFLEGMGAVFAFAGMVFVIIPIMKKAKII